MALDSSFSSSTASVDAVCNGKRLPKGIHVVRTDDESARRVKEVSTGEEEGIPWGYLSIHHYSAEKFEKLLETANFDGDFRPRCFIHRTVTLKRSANGRGMERRERPSISGLVFLQGKTDDLRTFLYKYFPQYHLVNDCSTGKPASIKDSVMQPFMKLMESEPEKISFLRDPLEKFAKDHVKLRVLTGLLTGMEGYIVRIMGNRRLVMDFGGNAVAISNVHNEMFEVAEQGD